MDSRIQKALELEVQKSIADSTAKHAALLEEIVARLDRIEAAQAPRDAPKPPSNLTVKGSR
jgi:hypothetical protein